MVNATTLARVKAHLGDAGTANDAILNALIESVSREIEAYVQYPLLQAERTEDYDLGLNDRLIFLRVVPVVSVAEVKVGPTDWDWAALTALTVEKDYHLGRGGQIYLRVTVRGGFQQARVKYTAGLGTTDAAVAAAAGDLALAAEIQVCEEWRRRDNPSTVTVPGPSGSKTLDAPHRLLPRARELLARYVRLAAMVPA